MGILVFSYPKPAANMKRFVAYSILLVGVAKSLPQEAGTNIAKLLENAGYTPICPDDQGEETPRNFDQIKNNANAKKQFIDPNKPQPCWHVVDVDYPKENCEKDFAKTCNKVQPFVGIGERNMCITFPNNEGVWYKLPGTFGYCGADNCCDFVVGGNCNPKRPLAQYFKGRCKSEYDDNTTGFTEGVELMKGTNDGIQLTFALGIKKRTFGLTKKCVSLTVEDL